MKLSESDEENLKRWIVAELQHRNQNNPSELAQYVISLLREDKDDRDALRSHCIEEARPFLKDQSHAFISALFDAISDGRYKEPHRTSDTVEGGTKLNSLPDVDEEDVDVVDYDEDEDVVADEDYVRNNRTEDLVPDDEEDEEQQQRGRYRRESDPVDGESRDRRDAQHNGSDRRRSSDRSRRDEYGYRSSHRKDRRDGQFDRNYRQGRNYHEQHKHSNDRMYSQSGYPTTQSGQMLMQPWQVPPNNNDQFMGLSTEPQFQQQQKPNPPPPPGPPPAHIIQEQQQKQSSQNPPVVGSSYIESESNAQSIEYNTYGQYMNSAYSTYQDHGYGKQNMPTQYHYDYQSGPGAGKKRRYQSLQLQDQISRLPENERCTLRCTKIRHYISDAALRSHFESFGHVVEMQVSQTSAPVKVIYDDTNLANEETEKKPDKECLVQFYSASNAKKCYNSPIPVANNRFIIVQVSPFNITPVSDVPAPSEDIIERDRQIAAGELKPRIRDSDYNNGEYKRKQQEKGESFKYRRIEGPTDAVNTVQVSSSNTSDGVEATVTAAPPPPPPLPPAPVVMTKADEELKERFDKLKSLRIHKEEIWKKKESLLQEQIDKCRKMIDQLESSTTESAKRQSLLQNLEGKIVELQRQLRTIREDRTESKNASDIMQSPPKAPFPSQGRGWGRGTFRGRGGYSRGTAGRGRGRGWNPGFNNQPFTVHHQTHFPVSHTDNQ